MRENFGKFITSLAFSPSLVSPGHRRPPESVECSWYRCSVATGAEIRRAPATGPAGAAAAGGQGMIAHPPSEFRSHGSKQSANGAKSLENQKSHTLETRHYASVCASVPFSKAVVQ